MYTNWVMVKRSNIEVHKPYYKVCKRIFDIVLCILILPLFSVLTLIIGALIRLESAGPIFYIQKRVGKDGHRFNVIKFRTMKMGAEESHKEFMKAFVKGEQELREGKRVFKPFSNSEVTRVGRFLRSSSLDEFPQILNILKGDMSLIGPRPNVVWEVEEYKGWHKERLEVLPGITGLAQVRGRSGILFDEIIRHDIEYVHNQSMWLDLKILWWTVSSVLNGIGAE
ncbi:sugar transferase [Chloroflexi bacterium TSY]|nr:sugar transferase [Chloroflexi bacterium TSY]